MTFEYLEKENIFFCQGEDKGGREKEGNIWRIKIFFAEEKKNIEGKEGQYFEKENICLQRRRIMEK